MFLFFFFSLFCVSYKSVKVSGSSERCRSSAVDPKVALRRSHCGRIGLCSDNFSALQLNGFPGWTRWNKPSLQRDSGEVSLNDLCQTSGSPLSRKSDVLLNWLVWVQPVWSEEGSAFTSLLYAAWANGDMWYLSRKKKKKKRKALTQLLVCYGHSKVIQVVCE